MIKGDPSLLTPGREQANGSGEFYCLEKEKKLKRLTEPNYPQHRESVTVKSPDYMCGTPHTRTGEITGALAPYRQTDPSAI